MKYTVITSFNQRGLEIYGQKMINTFAAHWPKEIDLCIYAENCNPVVLSPNITVVDIHQTCPNLTNFISRHRNNPHHNGQIDKQGHLVQPGDNFKLDAVRFSFKSYSITHATRNIDSDWIIWLDADVRTFENIPMSVIEHTCPRDSYSAHLGRINKFSETGFVTYNVKHSINETFMQHWQHLYDSDEIFNLKEYHDAYIYTYLKDFYETNRGVKFFNLTPPEVMTSKIARGHPFINSILGQYMDHLKGDRKDRGHSGTKQLIANHDVEYWQNQSRNQ